MLLVKCSIKPESGVYTHEKQNKDAVAGMQYSIVVGEY